MKKLGIIVVLMLGILLNGCGGVHYSNEKADDAIPQAIYRELGAEEIYYQGKSVSEKDVTSYMYLMYIEREGQLEELIEAANNALLESETTDKIAICCEVVFESCGGSSSVFSLQNYSGKTKKEADYQTFEWCNIWGTDLVETMYNEPSMYYNLPGIKVLIIEGEMAKRTKEQSVNWAEHYPDLETLRIIPD